MKRSIFGASLITVGLAIFGATSALAQTTPPPAPAKTTKTISVDFKDMAIREALDALFRGTGLNYALTPEASQAAPTVTLNLQDVSFDSALNILTKTAGLKFHKDRDTGVYMIVAKTPDVGATPVGASPTTTPETTATPDVAPEMQVEKIPLNYVDTLDMYGTLTGQGSNRAANMMGSSGGFGNSSFGSTGGMGNNSFGGGFGNSGFGNSGFGSSGFGSSGFGSSGFGSSGFGNSGFGSSGFGSSGYGNSGFGGFR